MPNNSTIRLSVLILSLAFLVYGLSPYKKTFLPDTKLPNSLVVEQQECGCPCPDARLVKGTLLIPAAILSTYSNLHKTELNLQLEGFNKPYNYELGRAKLYVTGQVEGVDTIYCNPSACEVAPRFKVESWALVDYVARVWTFPVWAALLFAGNMLVLFPTLAILAAYKDIKRLTRKWNVS